MHTYLCYFMLYCHTAVYGGLVFRCCPVPLPSVGHVLVSKSAGARHFKRGRPRTHSADRQPLQPQVLIWVRRSSISLATTTRQQDASSPEHVRDIGIARCLDGHVKCQTPSKTQTDKRRRDKRTDAGNRIWCILALKS